MMKRHNVMEIKVAQCMKRVENEEQGGDGFSHNNTKD